MSGALLHDMLRFWARRWGDRPAVKFADGSQVTWRALDRDTDRIAAGLSKLGVGKGDSVGILLQNRLEFIEAILAILKLGARVTILNARFTEREMLFPLRDAEIRAVITQPELLSILTLGRHENPDLPVVTTEPADGCIALATLRDCADAVPGVDVHEDDVALICYSSGTTSFPKGVMLSHRNVREGALATAIPCAVTHDDRVLITAPLAYTWGIAQYLREALISGATATLTDPSAGVDEVMDLLIRDRITMWSTVSIMFERAAASPRFAESDFSSLRHAVTGGASLHLLRQWQDKGVMLTQAYGLTETGGHVTMLFGEHARERIGWAGQALPGVELSIIDEKAVFRPAGEEGEIVVRGPMVMKGYLNRPQETAEAMLGDWLRTGDIGILDDEGFLKITGRSKDMVRSGGLNVYPAELERVLAGIEGMEEFAIIGVKDDRWDEVPMIVCHCERELDLPGLKRRCVEELANYKRPHFLFDYGKPLPRTFSGKIMKQALREEFDYPPPGVIRLKDR